MFLVILSRYKHSGVNPIFSEHTSYGVNDLWIGFSQKWDICSQTENTFERALWPTENTPEKHVIIFLSVRLVEQSRMCDDSKRAASLSKSYARTLQT